MAIDSIRISKNDRILKGQITLDGSKSLSNRALIIQALTDDDFEITGLSTSDDTSVLQNALVEEKATHELGHAGTSFRFLTAYYSFNNGAQILRGSDRMHNRPIGSLIEALNEIGANISYLEKEGYPPLKIDPPISTVKKAVAIDATVSSQFISALCLIAPTLPEGLEIKLEGDLVSRPYIQMTLDLMQHFGVNHNWIENSIEIGRQEYQAKDYEVEADWSAASYYYVMAAMAEEVDLKIKGLSSVSLQGDAVIQQIGRAFEIDSTFKDEILHLTKNKDQPSSFFENDFLTHPDLAQSVAVMCAATGIHGLFSGLQTLKIKETDRVAALKKELSKMQVPFYGLPSKKFSKTSGKEYYMVEGKASFDNEVEIETYKDHRMAMAFAPLAMLQPLTITDPDVVTKSYPDFWKDLESLGFIVERVNHPSRES